MVCHLCDEGSVERFANGEGGGVDWFTREISF